MRHTQVTRPGRDTPPATLFLGGLAGVAAVVVACSSSPNASQSAGDGGAREGGTTEGGIVEGSDGGATFGTLPIAGPDVDPPADLKLNPSVVIVHGGASVLKGVSSDHGVWTLDKSAAGVSSLVAGNIVLIAGVDIARVTAVEDAGDTVRVTVAPVSIVDVIQDGDLTWQDQDIDPTQGIVVEAPESVVLGAGTSQDAGSVTGAYVPVRLGVTDPSGKLSFKIANWTVDFQAVRQAKGVQITVGATVDGTKKATAAGITSLGTISGSLQIKATVNNVGGSSGGIHVAGSSLNSANLSVPMDGKVSVSASATTASGGQYPGQAVIKLPLAIEYPIACWAAIPCYVSFQVNLAFQPSLATVNSGFELAADFSLSGTSGFSFDRGSATATATPTLATPPSPLDSIVAAPSAGAIAMVASVQAPRVGFGLGTLSFAAGVKAGLFVDAINSFGLVLSPSTSLVQCKEVDWKGTANVGGEIGIKVLGGLTVGLEQSATIQKKCGSWYTPNVSSCSPGSGSCN